MKKIVLFLKFLLFYFLLLLISLLITGIILSLEIPNKYLLAYIGAYPFVIFLAYKVRKIDILSFFRPVNLKILIKTCSIAIVLNLTMRFDKVFLDGSFFEIENDTDYFFASLFLASFFEELFFRGFMLKEFRKIINNDVFPVVFISLIFGALHIMSTSNIYSGFIFFVFSVVLCILMIRYKNIWYCIAFHSVYNLISLLT